MVVANHEKILGTDEKAQNKTKQKNDNNVLIVRTKRQIFNFVLNVYYLQCHKSYTIRVQLPFCLKISTSTTI